MFLCGDRSEAVELLASLITKPAAKASVLVTHTHSLAANAPITRASNMLAMLA